METEEDKLIRKKWKKICWNVEDWKDFYRTLKEFKLRVIFRREKPMLRVIEGCQHSKKRMVTWIENGACPICLTASSGILKEENARVRHEEREKCIAELEAFARNHANKFDWNEVDAKSESWTILQAIEHLKIGLNPNP